MFSKLIYEHAWYHFLLCLIAALLPALWLYYRNKRQEEAPIGVLRLLFALRFFSFFGAALLLLHIFVRRVQTEKESPIVVLAIDNSSSIIAGKDSAEKKKELIQAIENLQTGLQTKFEVKSILFGATTKIAERPTFADRETDIDQVLKDVENDFGNQNVGALVVLSDGIYNKGSNPLYSSEKSQFPMYTVGLGDTTEHQDVWIQKINHNEVAYLGNNFPVEIQVNALQCKDQKLTLKLFQNEALLQSKELLISQDQYSSLSTFTLTAKTPGLVRYTVQVSKANQELTLDNNSRSFVMEIISNQEKVALISVAPHHDLSALREVLLSNSSSQLEQFQLPEKPNSFKAYSLVILHGYARGNENLVAQCKSENVPYWIIAPSTFEGLSGLKPISNMTRTNDVEAVIDPNFGYFQLSAELRRFLPELPAVKSMFGRFEESAGTQVLLNQKLGSVESTSPLLLFQEVNGLKSALYTGDGLWRWSMQDYAKHGNHNLFAELISKCCQYLAVKSDKSFFRLQAPKISSENERIEFGAEVYDKSYQSVTEPEVSMVVKGPGGKSYNYTFSRQTKSYHLELGTLSAGEYNYVATTKFNNEVFERRGVFVVKEVLSEKLGSTANHSLLRQISQQTGGQFFKVEQLAELQARLLSSEQIKPIVYTQTITSPLVDLKWLFFILLILLSTEWWLRKRYFNI